MATGGRGELFAVIRQSLERTLAKPQNSANKPAAKPQGEVKPADRPGTVTPDTLPQDTVQPDNLQDTVESDNPLQDTVKPAYLLQDTVKPAYLLQDNKVKPAKLSQDTAKPAPLPQFTVKFASAAKLPQDTGKPAPLLQFTVKAAKPQGKVKPANRQGPVKPDKLPQDTVQPYNLQDTVKPAKPPQATGKPAPLPQFTVKAANAAKLPQDTVKPAYLLQDKVKPAKPPQDTGKPAPLPQFTVIAANAAKLPPDTVKPAYLLQDKVKPAKPPQDTGKPVPLPQFTVIAANAAKLPQDTVVKPAKKKKKKKNKPNNESPKELSTVQRSPVCEEMAAQKAYVPRKELSKSAGKSSLALTQNFIEMLPPEVLVKILSYLDVSSLDYISQVSKMFRQLASDDAIWQRLYMSEFGEKRCWKPKGMDNMDMVKVQDRPVGYWKRLYRTMAGNEVRSWKGELKDISPYTGLPSRTKYVLRTQGISWELTVCDKQGKLGTFHDAQAHFSESAVILCWSEGHWPRYHNLSTLQIHGVTKNGPKKPGCQSLMAKFDTQNLTRAPTVIGKDRLVMLVCLEPGLTVGIWRGQQDSIAFVMASFHFHKLVEKSLLGTPLCPYSVPLVKPPFDDIDPEYGLHGYRLHICLHNTATEMMSGYFSHLFCPKAEIKNDLIRLTVINKRKLAQHTILSGNITLPWKCAVLEGAVENCCVLSLTLLDEFQKPFWCVSTPACMDTAVKYPSYDYDGDHFSIVHHDSEGCVKMELVWMEEHKQYFLVYLAMFLSVHKVNEHFGREYCST